MVDGERKSLVWAINKDLLTLSADKLFQIAKSVALVPEMDQSRLKLGDEESCFKYISSFMCSKPLLESVDSGMAHLLELRDVIDMAIQGHVSDSQVHVPGESSHDVFSNLQTDDNSIEVSHRHSHSQSYRT